MKKLIENIGVKVAGGAVESIQKSGKVVGNAINYVSESELYKLLSEKLGVNWLFDQIIKVDIKKTTRQVEKFRKKFPDATPAEIADKLTTHKAYYTAAIGFTSGIIPGNIPAILFDFITTIGAQAELVYEIALVYGMDLEDETRKGEVLTLIALSAGSTKTAEAALKVAMDVSAKRLGPVMAQTMIKGLALVIGEKLAKRFISKMIPLVGGFIGAGLNLSMITLTGRGAKSFYQNITSSSYVYSGLLPEDLKKVYIKTDENIPDAEIKDNLVINAIIHLLKQADYSDETISEIIQEYFPEVKEDPELLDRVEKEIQQPDFNQSLLENINKTTASLIITKAIMAINHQGSLNDYQKSFLKKLAERYGLLFEES